MLKKIPKRTLPFSFQEMLDFWRLLFKGAIDEGPFVRSFEEKFKDFVGTRETIALSSGRFGLALVLKNLGLNKGDGIMLSAYNFQGVPKALVNEGYVPVFVDADERTFQMDPEDVERRMAPNVKAILLTHLFGQPADVNRFKAIAEKNGLYLIEDAAHSLGSYYQGRHTGTLTDAGFFSFAGSKTLNTSFGGMVVTENKALASAIREDLEDYGFPPRGRLIKQRIITHLHGILTNRIIYSLLEYPVTLMLNCLDKDPLEIYKSMKKKEVSEYKMKFTNLQGLLGLRQIEKSGTYLERRRQNAKRLFERLAEDITLQEVPPDCNPNHFMIALKTRNKKEAFRKLLMHGIDSNLNYASDCAALYKEEGRPVARRLSEKVITVQLPFKLREKEIDEIAAVLNGLKDEFV